MTVTDQSSTFQRAIETIETLSLNDQEALLELLQKRLIEQRRKRLMREIAEVRQEYAQGQVQFGSVADFMAELDK
jgi:homoserine kinase